MNSQTFQVNYDCLVVAGGASKCISALGALYFCDLQNKLRGITKYSGTSAGGIICYLMCIGYTPFELIKFIISSSFIEEFQRLNLTAVIDRKGLINYYVIQDYFEKLTLNKIGYLPTFRDLRIKFGKDLTLASYNVSQNEIEYFNADTYPDVPCLTALRMTVNVPLLFERFFYGGSEYIDGGLVDNFPIDYYASRSLRILGININPLDNNKHQNYVMYLLKIAMIPYMFFNSKKKYPENSDVIEIKSDVQTFDFHLTITKRLDLFSIGCKTAMMFFEKDVNEECKEVEDVESGEKGESDEKNESIEKGESGECECEFSEIIKTVFQ